VCGTVCVVGCVWLLAVLVGCSGWLCVFGCAGWLYMVICAGWLCCCVWCGWLCCWLAVLWLAVRVVWLAVCETCLCVVGCVCVCVWLAVQMDVNSHTEHISKLQCRILVVRVVVGCAGWPRWLTVCVCG